MAEEQTPRSKKELLIERLRAKYPDDDYTNEDILFGRIGDDYDTSEKDLAHYRESEGRFADMFASNPQAAQFFTDMAQGVDPWIAIIKRIGIDGVTELLNDPEKQEAYAAANKEHAERLAENTRLEEEADKNLTESMAFRDEMNARYGEETVDAAIAVIDQIFRDALVGKVTPETFDMALKAVTHDADMENARTEGEIAGRNDKIDEMRRGRSVGDGMPRGGGGNNGPKEPRKYNVFDLAEAAS